MKNKIYFLVLSLISYLLSLAAVPTAHADFTCQPIYGGGQTCVLNEAVSVNKTVINPQTGRMVENLGVNDPKFLADQIITFQIAVTNTSNSVISRVTIKDTLPQFTLFNAGPGNFDAATNSLMLSMDNLSPNETRTITMVGKIVSLGKLPSSMITCVVNQVTATTNNGAGSSDNAQFCIERQAVPAVTKPGFPVFAPAPLKANPATGPESIVLFSLIPTGLTGFFLRKYTAKKEKN